eukprot:TRINITY_DN923_c0_g1_i1.p1 TRINITY_DN923_c0_g1~~TRINITY_DN923_c0_g1_i1.p1  ORF type:complete len:251 (-),score=36.28 TRINITY_DN923_c0_g1_i1:69-740(-)
MAEKKVFQVYSYKPSPAVAKAAIAGKFGGVEIDYIEPFEMGKTNKTDEYLKLNPNGQVPTLVTPDGPIWESTAIAYYVARAGTDAKGLLGETAYQQAQVDEWVHFARSRLEGLYPLFAWTFGYGTYQKDKFDETHKKVVDAIAVVERHLTQTGGAYLVGSRVTLADIIFFSSLAPVVRVGFSEEDFQAYPKSRAYLQTLIDNPNFNSVSGPVNVVAKFTPPAN